nr:DNA mismatch repair protein Mlh3-like isoform X1 [Procambarus clarkii]
MQTAPTIKKKKKPTAPAPQGLLPCNCSHRENKFFMQTAPTIPTTYFPINFIDSCYYFELQHMLTMSGKILPLPESVRSQLRSGITIISVAQCVEELVLNSLDANATCIAVRVDFGIFRIQIVDNGYGIRHRDLKYLGTRHATSKCHTLDDLNSNLSHYGFRGEALASIVDMAAIVDITTKPRGSTQTFSKLFTYGQEKSVSVIKNPRPSAGTTLTVQDFMYNMPVRRKLIKEAIDIESIRKRLESFALMHPEVSFSFRNDKNGTVIMQTSKCTSIMSTFMQLFGADKAQALAEVEHTLDQFSISGYISTQPHLTKALQFVYVNKRVILKTKIHKILNWLLARSSIISSRLHPSSSGPGKTPSSPAKGMNLYGIYLINIECPYSDYDICLEPTKTLVEFKDWDKLLLCIEEMIIKFIQEENLVISIDERYRRSGKDQEMEDEGSLTMTQNSPSLLDMFSLKRAGEESSVQGVSQEKYGLTLCTQDNLLAVHSLPVKRAKKSHNKFDRFSSINTNEDNTEDIAIHKNAVHESSFSSKESGKNNTSQDEHLECDSSPPIISMFDSKLQGIDNIYKSNSNTKDISETENTNTGMSSSLEQFKRFIDDSLESDKLLKEKGTSNLNHVVVKTGVPLLKKNCDISENGEYENKLPKNVSENMSSLEEFMNFYNADRRKTELESFKTPEQAVRHTPSTPPLLNITRSSLQTSEKLGDDLDFDTNLRSNIKKTNENKSLTKSLSSRLKKHQNKTKTLQTLQNFGYNKTNVMSGYSNCMSGNARKFNEQKDKCCDKTQPNILPSWEEVEASVQGPEHKQSKIFNDDKNDFNSSFRFQPVISKKIEPKNDMREFLSDGERFVENLEINDDDSLCYKKPTRQESISVEREPLVPREHSDKFCSSKEVHRQLDLETHEVLDTTENFNTCSYITTILEQPNKYIHQHSKVSTSFEKETSHYQSKCERTIEGVDPVEPINKVIHPLDSSRSNHNSVKSTTVLEEKLMTSCPLEVVTEHDPPLLHVPYVVHARKENTEKSDQSSVSHSLDFDSSNGVCSASSSTQPFQLENISYSNNPCNRLHSEDNQGTDCAIIHESQGFTLSDSCTSLQNKIYSGLNCENKEEDNSAAVRFSEGFTPPDDLNENVNYDITITTAHKTHVKSIDSNPSTIHEDVDDTRGITNTTSERNNGNDIHEEYEQSYILPQNYEKEDLKDINSSTVKIINVAIRSHSQTLASHTVKDRKFFSENTIQNESLQCDESKFEVKKQHVLPLLSSFDIQNNTIDITDSSKNVVDEETNSPSSKSPNPFSESLHFSQLTIPEDMAAALPKSWGTSSVNTCDSEKTESVVFSLGSLSSCSSLMIPKAKQKLPSCEITFHGKMINVGGNYSTQKGNLENASEELQCTSNTTSLIAKSCALKENSTRMSSDLESFGVKPKDNIIINIEENKTITNQVYNDVTLCSSRENNADPQNPQDDSIQGVNNTQANSTQAVNNTQDDSTQGFSNAQDDSTQEVNNAQDDNNQRVTNDKQDDNTQGVNNEQDDSTQGVNNAACPGNRWKEVYDKSGRKVYIHLKTGNTSYDPPPQELVPEWTSSQPLGAPLLKIPLTHEPWYNPLGKVTANRQAFTLSHGFNSLLSWKKSKDIEENKDLSRKSKYSTRLNMESSLNNTCSTNINIQEKEGNNPVAVSEDDSLLTAEVSEAIALLLKDSETDEDTIKWSSKPTELHQDKPESAEVAEICQLWEAPQFAMDADILTSEVQATTAERGAITKKGAVVRVYNIVHPYKFSREMLQSCKVIGQLDKKFIACSITYPPYDYHEQRPSELIVLFDQHAVHERVRLEAIIKENFEVLDSGESVVRSSTITPPLEMSLPEDEVRMMMAFSEIFIQRGLHFTQISPSKVRFQSIPSCLVAKEANEVRHKRCQTASAIVESIVRDMCHTLHQTAGVVGVVPKPITYVLNSIACRGAVKFGDELTLSQCEELISSLWSCQLPFQCAHGRPSIVPIVNLTHLATINKKESKPNLRKLRDALLDCTGD